MSELALRVVCGLLVVAGAVGQTLEANRYNVVFIAVDDLRPPLGADGAAYVPTPNLDRLASEGVWFSRHYSQVPTCGASRYSLLTGRSPRHTGVTASNQPFWRAPTALSTAELDGAQSMPELFRRSGYRTVSIGKISHTPDGRIYEYDGSGDGRVEMPLAWDELPTPFGEWKRGWGAFFAYRGGRHREDDGGYKPLSEFLATSDEELPDGLIAAESVRRLRGFRKSGERFFLGVGFYKPHLPFVATREDWEAVAKVEVPDAPHPGKIASNYWHKSGEFFRYTLPFARANPLPAGDRSTARRAYLAAVRYADRQIGKVLAALEETGLSRDTVVVVWSDHGWHLGEFSIWGKHTPFERALNSVLIVRAPGSRTGVRSEALVESLDLYPTLVDLCQPSFRQTHHSLDGRSLVPILTGERDSVREAAISYWRKAISIRTATHRLIASETEGKLTGVELYPMSGGPDAARNIAAENPALVERLWSFVPE